MAGQGAFRAVAALTAALAGIPAMAQQSPGVADFLATIGGDTDMKTSGSLRTRPSPQVFPQLDDADEIIGYRFFSEKITANGSATAERARGLSRKNVLRRAAGSSRRTGMRRAPSVIARLAAGCRPRASSSTSGPASRRCARADLIRCSAASSRSPTTRRR